MWFPFFKKHWYVIFVYLKLYMNISGFNSCVGLWIFIYLHMWHYIFVVLDTWLYLYKKISCWNYLKKYPSYTLYKNKSNMYIYNIHIYLCILFFKKILNFFCMKIFFIQFIFLRFKNIRSYLKSKSEKISMLVWKYRKYTQDDF